MSVPRSKPNAMNEPGHSPTYYASRQTVRNPAMNRCLPPNVSIQGVSCQSSPPVQGGLGSFSGSLADVSIGPKAGASTKEQSAG